MNVRDFSLHLTFVPNRMFFTVGSDHLQCTPASISSVSYLILTGDRCRQLSSPWFKCASFCNGPFVCDLSWCSLGSTQDGFTLVGNPLLLTRIQVTTWFSLTVVKKSIIIPAIIVSLSPTPWYTSLEPLLNEHSQVLLAINGFGEHSSKFWDGRSSLSLSSFECVQSLRAVS